MRRSVCLVLMVGALAVVAGCESRERSNPFDPRNPDTGGVPALVDARAGNGVVTLSWGLGEYAGLLMTRVHRRQPGQAISDLTPDGLDPSLRTFIDFSARNGVAYDYRLEVELDTGGRLTTDWDPATPGDAIAWLADSDGGGLARLTPDARDRSIGLGNGRWFLDLAIDHVTETVWSVDFLEGLLFEHTFDGQERLRIPLVGARAVDVDLEGGGIWVGSFDRQRLERRRRDGGLAWSDESAGFVEDLLAAQGGGVWLCNLEGDLRLYRDDAVQVSIVDLSRPVALATATGGTIHVLERDGLRISRYDLTGFPLGSSPTVLVEPLDLTSDGAGGAWVADPGRGGLVRFDVRLKESNFVPLEGVLGVTWDDHDRTLWVAGPFGVQILDEEGAFISGGSFGPRPIKVEVIHGASPR